MPRGSKLPPTYSRTEKASNAWRFLPRRGGSRAEESTLLPRSQLLPAALRGGAHDAFLQPDGANEAQLSINVNINLTGVQSEQRVPILHNLRFVAPDIAFRGPL
jgi:hypothetical protein